MAFSDSKKGNQYVNDYKKENYDRITILVRKGDKLKYSKLAAASGLSLSQWFVFAAESKIISDYHGLSEINT